MTCLYKKEGEFANTACERRWCKVWLQWKPQWYITGYSDNDPDHLPAQGTQHPTVLLEEEQHHTSSTSPLKYMQVSIDAMRVVAQETELRPNIKTREEEIENDSSRDQEAAPTPDTQKSEHAQPSTNPIHLHSPCTQW